MTLKGEHYKITDDGEVSIWGLGTDTQPTSANGTLTLWGSDLKISNGVYISSVFLPDWLADGIRELVKNKIEQENDRGA